MKKVELPKCKISQQTTNSEFKVPNLDRGLSVFEYLSNYPDGLSMSDIARALDIPKNSAHRIMMTMWKRGFLYRNDKNKKFSLTQKLLAIGSSAVSEKNLNEVAIEIMRNLRDLVEETVLLDTRIDDHGVVLEQITSKNSIRLVIDPGTHYELHSSAPGKVALAFTPEKEQDELLNKLKFTQYTVNTLTDKEKLLEELKLVKEQGIGYDRCEAISGVNCLSAPIFNRNGQCVAALTVSGTTGTIPQSRFKELAPIVIQHAQEISNRLI